MGSKLMNCGQKKISEGGLGVVLTLVGSSVILEVRGLFVSGVQVDLRLTLPTLAD